MKIRPSEFGLIEKYFAPLAGEGAFRLRDDAALLPVPEGKQLVITQDALAAGIHFFADDPPDLIAKKALRVNLSDLAAKGASPYAYSLALGLDETWNEDWIAAFARGLAEDQAKYNISLTGGDTFKAPGGTTLSITSLGLVDPVRYISRLGAKTGDIIFVSGTIGDAALGLLVKQGEMAHGLFSKSELAWLVNRYLLPQPPTQMAAIIGEFASASMDISDGLMGDLEKLCAASGVGATILDEDIPLSKPVKKAINALPELHETALTGGDDYEILFTVPLEKLQDFTRKTASLSRSFTKIGVVVEGVNDVRLIDKRGKTLSFDKTSYRHF